MKTQVTLPTVVSPAGRTVAVQKPTEVTMAFSVSNNTDMQKMSSAQDNSLTVGSRFEKYEIEKFLAKGGMGSVYLVRHVVLDTRFALKILSPEAAAHNRDFIERFIREAKLSSQIRHPNLIIVHDAGKNDETGLYYLVMDYVPNGTLRDRLAMAGRILPCGAIGIVRQIAEALREAHRCGMIHRDIKPENIMFDENGNARLADLGIAKSTGAEDIMLTMAAAVMGTPCYMSPEQAKDSGKIDERADIYSLGIVFYEMLTGCCPFTGNTPVEVLSKVISEEKALDITSLNPDISNAMAILVHDMIEKNPDKRIATADILVCRLNSINDDVNIDESLKKENGKEVEVCKGNNDASKSTFLRLIILGLVGLLGVVAFIVLFDSGREESNKDQSSTNLGYQVPSMTNIIIKSTGQKTNVVNVVVKHKESSVSNSMNVVVEGMDQILLHNNNALKPTQQKTLISEILFSPQGRTNRQVMEELERVISMKPQHIRVSLTQCGIYRDMSPRSFEYMAIMVIERLKIATGISFALDIDGGRYGMILQDLARKYGCDICK